MFFLLYKHADDSVFDYFSKISNHFRKINEDFPKLLQRPDEPFWTFSENFSKIAEDDRRTFEDKVQYEGQKKLSKMISSHVRISHLHMSGFT